MLCHGCPTQGYVPIKDSIFDQEEFDDADSHVLFLLLQLSYEITCHISKQVLAEYLYYYEKGPESSTAPLAESVDPPESTEMEITVDDKHQSNENSGFTNVVHAEG